jgi:hypothetical protein
VMRHGATMLGAKLEGHDPVRVLHHRRRLEF